MAGVLLNSRLHARCSGVRLSEGCARVFSVVLLPLQIRVHEDPASCCVASSVGACLEHCAIQESWSGSTVYVPADCATHAG